MKNADCDPSLTDSKPVKQIKFHILSPEEVVSDVFSTHKH